MRYDEVARVPGYPLWGGGTNGPLALPGSYQVRLTVNGKSSTAPLEVRKDQKQFELVSQIQSKVGDSHTIVMQIRDARRQIDDLSRRLNQTKDPHAKAVADAGKQLEAKMKPIEESLIQVKNKSGQDLLSNGMKLNNQLAALAGEVETSYGAPTNAAYEVFKMLSGQLDTQVSAWRTLVENDLKSFNQLVRQQDVPAIVIDTKTSTGAQTAAKD